MTRKSPLTRARSLFNRPGAGIAVFLRRGRFAGDAAWMNISGSEQDVVEGLYLRFLSRPPETQELKTAIRFLHKAENRKQGSEDIAWALINSTEFVHAL